MRWGTRSMAWYVFILLIAFVVSIFYYTQFIHDPEIERIFFGY